MVRIIAQVPTVHQLQSIAAMSRGTYWSYPDGSFVWLQEFNDEGSAKSHLVNLAYILAEDGLEFCNMQDDIIRYGQLTYDGCTARIEKF